MAPAEVTLKHHVKGTVHFEYYRNGELWYRTSETKLLFPVPIADTGEAMFMRNDKALLFMRYIRKWLDVCAEGKGQDATHD